MMLQMLMFALRMTGKPGRKQKAKKKKKQNAWYEIALPAEGSTHNL